MFSNLFRHNRREQQQDEQLSQSSEEAQRAWQGQLSELRQSTCDRYRNDRWTRLIALEHHRPEDERSWPIGPDLADEFDFFFLNEEEELPPWWP